MGLSQEIRILDLLAYRDAEFLRVRECEDRIRQILDGEAFPFPPPPVPLPSAGRKGKPFRPAGLASAAKDPTSSRKAPSSPGKDPVPLEIPPLEPPRENCYRLVFLDKGETKVSYLQNPRQVQEMLSLACPTFQVTCVETASLRTLDDFTTLRRIL
ncbi:MAG: hypothetical protein ACI4SG_09320 [Oligosphaeraceae bacterium]